jgi:hypothetical protein
MISDLVLAYCILCIDCNIEFNFLHEKKFYGNDINYYISESAGWKEGDKPNNEQVKLSLSQDVG